MIFNKSIIHHVLYVFIAAALFFVAASVTFRSQLEAAPATFTVTNTNDSGAGSLRDAITSANNNSNPSDQDIIEFNINQSGDVTIQPQTMLEITQSVLINGYTQSDAEPNALLSPNPFDGTLRVEIDNSVAGPIKVISDNVTLQGLVINRSSTTNILVDKADNFELLGSYIDTDPSGLLGRRDTDATSSIDVLGSSDVRIGGADAADRNIFARCDTSCIFAEGSGEVEGIGLDILGNYFSVGSDGITNLGPNLAGRAILIQDGVEEVQIGADFEGAGNTISRNSGGAIKIEDVETINIYGNRIINNVNYTANGIIVLAGVTDAVIGANSELGRNILAGNVDGAAEVIIQDSEITSNPSLNVWIQGNYFGVLEDGETPYPTQTRNIWIKGSSEFVFISNNIIKNTLFNAGVSITENSQSVSILNNSIYNNGYLGIDLEGDGVTQNDSNDSDSGPNGYLNFPESLTWNENDTTTEMSYSLDVPAGDYRVEFYANTVLDNSGYGEGETFLGFHNITKSGSGAEQFSHELTGVSHQNITATATLIDSNSPTGYGPTSEFSQVATEDEPDFDLAFTKELLNPEDVEVGATLNYEVTVTNNGPDSIDINGFDGSTFGTNNLFIDVLPDELSFVSGSGTNITCSSLGEGSAPLLTGELGDHSDHELVTCDSTGVSTILDEGESTTVTVSVTVDVGSDLIFANYILGAYSEYEPDAGEVQALYGIPVDIITVIYNTGEDVPNNFAWSLYPNADLGVTKELINPEDVEVGGTISYKITVTNHGPDPIDISVYDGSSPPLNFLFIDILPAELSFVSGEGTNLNCGSAGPGSASLFGPALGNHSDDELLFCSVTGESLILDEGESVVATIDVSVDVGSDLAFTNYVVGPRHHFDPDEGVVNDAGTSGGDFIDYYLDLESLPNNFAYSQFPITDLSIEKTLENPEDVAVGATLNFNLTLKNEGPHPIDLTAYDASGINPLATALMVDILPPQLSYEGTTTPDVSCNWAGEGSASSAPIFSNHNDHSLLICAYTGSSSLAAGDTFDLTIQVSVNEDAESLAFINYALAGTLTTDPDLATVNDSLNNSFGGSDFIDNILESEVNNFASVEFTPDDPEPEPEPEDPEGSDAGNNSESQGGSSSANSSTSTRRAAQNDGANQETSENTSVVQEEQITNTEETSNGVNIPEQAEANHLETDTPLSVGKIVLGSLAIIGLGSTWWFVAKRRHHGSGE